MINNKGKTGYSREEEKLITLLDISQSLYQYLNIDDLILHIIRRTKEVLNAEGVSVILYDEDTNEFVFCWSESEPPEFVTKLKEFRFPGHVGIAGRVFKSGKPELSNDIAKDHGRYKDIDKITGFQTKSWRGNSEITARIYQVDGEVERVVLYGSPEQSREFSEVVCY